MHGTMKLKYDNRDPAYYLCRSNWVQFEKKPPFIIMHFEGPPDLRGPSFCGVWGSAGVFSTIPLYNSDMLHIMKK